MEAQIDWYERRYDLEPGQVFTTRQDVKIRLDRRVPGDGTDWYADIWHNNHWSCEDYTIHPADLIERIEETAQ